MNLFHGRLRAQHAIVLFWVDAQDLSCLYITAQVQEFGTTLEHMLPPFSQSVRAAAMACFVQLAKHEGYAMLFAGNSQMKALVGRLGRSDEAIVQQNLTEPARSTSPLGKVRSLICSSHGYGAFIAHAHT
eukprot:1145032-Pelagomonas_calceolata.AAC.5